MKPRWASSSSWGFRPKRLLLTGAGLGLLFLAFRFYWKWYFLSPAPWRRVHVTLPEPDLVTFSQDDVDLFASQARNGTVVVVPVNTGMLYWAQNLLCSLQTTSFNTSSIIFWALDEEAETTLKSQGHTTYRDPSLYSVRNDTNYSGNTDEYRRLMRERPQFYINVLASGFNLLMIDVDIVFYQSPLLLVPDESEDERIDIVYSTDAREFYTEHDAFDDPLRKGPLVPPICNGLFWMRSFNETVALWVQMKQIFADTSLQAKLYSKSYFRDDQRGMDVMLNDGRVGIVAPFPEGISYDNIPRSSETPTVNLVLLDQTEVVNGQLITVYTELYEEKLAKLREAGSDRIAAHMNWGTKNMSKLEGAKMYDFYHLDDNGSCKVAD